MKKRFIILIFVFIFFVISTISSIYVYKKHIELKDKQIKENLNKNIEQISEPSKKIEQKYIDNNPIKIGLYVNENGKKKLVTNYYSIWNAENIMGIFYAVATNEEIIQGSNYQNIWKQYWEKYENAQKCKIGYNIKFTMDTGEVIDQIILNPDQAYLMYPKVQFYLYDDVNLIAGKPYYHITKDTFNEETKCTSIKIVGDNRTKNIISNIELSAFTYDGEDDFDPITGKYRGNSIYTIYINRK
ncbi:MAG: hypothetical protein RSB67_00770 [Clostridia bacterium]